MIIKELKCCPFCGGQAELKQSKVFGSYNKVYVHCKQCGSIGRAVADGKTVAFIGMPSREISLKEAIDTAIEAWNRRNNDETPGAATPRASG